MQLARDAQSSGDPVAAENYYQHAEHYFRLIAAAQEQFRQNNPYYRDNEPRDATFRRRRGRRRTERAARHGRERRRFRPARAAAALPAARAAAVHAARAAASTYSRDQSDRSNPMQRPPQQRQQHQRAEAGEVDRLPAFVPGAIAATAVRAAGRLWSERLRGGRARPLPAAPPPPPPSGGPRPEGPGHRVKRRHAADPAGRRVIKTQSSKAVSLQIEWRCAIFLKSRMVFPRVFSGSCSGFRRSAAPPGDGASTGSSAGTSRRFSRRAGSAR